MGCITFPSFGDRRSEQITWALSKIRRYYSKQFVSATPLKQLNRVSWNFVVVKEIPCRCAYPQEILIQLITPFLKLEIWPKWKILLKLFVSVTPLKPLNRISWNFVVVKDILCRYTYPQEILIHFFSRRYSLFELRNLIKMKDTTETVYQRNSSEVAQQNLWNFVVMKDLIIMCRCAYLQEFLINFFGVMPLLNLEFRS